MNKINTKNFRICIVKYILVFPFTFIVLVTGAQITNKKSLSDTVLSPHRNIFSVELGGNGILYSLNYSRIFKQNIIARIGLAVVGDKNNLYDFQLPLELYFRSGRSKHHFELGLGFTPAYMMYYNYWYTIILGRIGYSYHKPGSRWNFRLGFTPFFSREISYRIIQPFGGISFGYLF